jgi:membrane-associated phospholipid phosphatase
MALHVTQMTDDHRNRYFVALGAAIVALGLLILLVREHTLTGFELSFFRSINNLPDSWHTMVEIISEGGLFLGAGIAVVLACLRRFKLAWRLVASMGSAYIAAKIVKTLIDRPRPEGMLGHLNLRVAESGAGFPSAHATIITVTLLTLFPYLPRKWRWVIVPIGIALVSLSRLYLGVHSPYDVLGGIALGVIIVSIIRILPRSIKVFCRLD